MNTPGNEDDERVRANAYIDSLNDVQYAAATAQDNVLLILAGPGSGKTRTLTARVIDLIVNRRVDPAHVAVMTFTNKAANEMKERIHSVLGYQRVSRLVIGTFHSVCSSFLRAYAPRIGLPANFIILDSSDTEQYIKRILKSNIFEGSAAGKPFDFRNKISRAKARNMTYADEQAAWDKRSKTKMSQGELNDNLNYLAVFREYDRLLRENNAMDFDDLLVYGLKVIKAVPAVAATMQHVLVDEFQDTNMIQLQLTLQLVAKHKRLTIVGDPDQSIYGWRSADASNLTKLEEKFPHAKSIYLEENYRSTPTILHAASLVISQDKMRVQKKLFTKITGGLPILVNEHHDPSAEAAYLANQIQTLVGKSGGTVDYCDFAVLCRTGALTRAVEEAFVQNRVPHIIVGGLRFFERAEIRDLLAYLRVVDNPGDQASFERAIQVPARGIGEGSVFKMMEAATRDNVTCFEIARRLEAGKRITGVTRVRVDALKSFVSIIEALHRMTQQETYSIADLLNKLVELTKFKDHLLAIDAKNMTSRWENVEELINNAQSFSPTTAPVAPVEVEMEGEDAPEPDSLLSNYLHMVSLSNPTDAADGEQQQSKVVISTLHASKGLEWPVVFVCGTDMMPHPLSKTDAERAEERRLLYVGMTRAQRILYLTSPTKRTAWGGNPRACCWSPYLACLFQKENSDSSVRFNGAPLVVNRFPGIDEATLKYFAKLREARPSSVTPEMAVEILATADAAKREQDVLAAKRAAEEQQRYGGSAYGAQFSGTQYGNRFAALSSSQSSGSGGSSGGSGGGFQSAGSLYRSSSIPRPKPPVAAPVRGQRTLPFAPAPPTLVKQEAKKAPAAKKVAVKKEPAVKAEPAAKLATVKKEPATAAAAKVKREHLPTELEIVETKPLVRQSKRLAAAAATSSAPAAKRAAVGASAFAGTSAAGASAGGMRRFVTKP
ncbi:ATP-dependent DNA helicase srs2 [Blastocladiella emersonii ATCC 22665]|nr:ATP-dependent DNA helicase srs2 [Blastocladiella emersonii ATCC 22665]